MKKRTLFLPLAAATLLALSGCAALQGDDDAFLSDDSVAAIATTRLNSDSMTARSTLSVDVDNGLAILYGTVPDETVRQRAIQILEGTEGIYEVLDRTRKR